jgi:hypothetical protein
VSQGRPFDEGKTLADLRKLGHNLPKIWEEFKVQVSDPALDQFDTLISELNAFEEIRYPDQTIEKGMRVMMDPGSRASAPAGITSSSGGSMPEYTLFLGDIDELIGKALAAIPVNLDFYTRSLKKEAKQYLNERNEIGELTAE